MCGAYGLLGMDFVENRTFEVRQSVMESNAYGCVTHGVSNV
jgi:hypothetical protein